MITLDLTAGAVDEPTALPEAASEPQAEADRNPEPDTGPDPDTRPGPTTDPDPEPEPATGPEPDPADAAPPFDRSPFTLHSNCAELEDRSTTIELGVTDGHGSVPDSQGRELSVVALGDSADAVMAELYPGLELHDADDEVFSRTGHCEPEDSFG